MESQQLQSLDAVVAMMRSVLEDAVTRLAGSTLWPVNFADLNIYSFQQRWLDASCGFGGIAAQVMTDA
jgi:hypothetical protein